MAWALQSLPELSDAEFSIWLTLLEERTGISFERHKRILQTGLSQRMREVGCDNYADYYQQVSAGKRGALEWEALLRTLTIKETRFFRDGDAFDLVRRYLFRLLSQKNTGRSVDLWSVACSTGEEAYSLGMVVNDCIEGLRLNKFFGVTATDICIDSLARARKGIFNARKVEVIDPPIRDRYFHPVADGYEIDSGIKKRTCFVQTNIIEYRDFPPGLMDIIYCQNILVYFKQWRQYEVLDRLILKLKPGGLLVVGSSESLGWQGKGVERVQDASVNAYIRTIK